MPEVLVAEPANSDKRQQSCEYYYEAAGSSSAKPAFQENEQHDQRQHAVNHVAKEQAPMEQFHRRRVCRTLRHPQEDFAVAGL
jgi:hypothetical protein